MNQKVRSASSYVNPNPGPGPNPNPNPNPNANHLIEPEGAQCLVVREHAVAHVEDLRDDELGLGLGFGFGFGCGFGLGLGLGLGLDDRVDALVVRGGGAQVCGRKPAEGSAREPASLH